MVVQPEYTNSYPGYGPNAYQYGSSIGPSVYSSSLLSTYSPGNTCYAMPPPQHMQSQDKLFKDG
jgi:hypothetical protein